MAAAYARARAAEAGLAEVEIDSAGTLGIEDHPASPEAVLALGEHGIPLDGHRSRGFTEDDADSADLIVVMARGHREEILRLYPQARARVRLLREWESGLGDLVPVPDLDDPIGEPLEVYRATFAIIRRSVDNLVESLRRSRIP